MAPEEYAQLVEFLGRQFTAIDRRFTDVHHDIADLRGEVAGLHGEVADLRRDMLGHFDALYRRLEGLEQEYQAITQALRRIEAGLANEAGRREILEHDLADLKRQVAALQSRIGEIEQRLQ